VDSGGGLPGASEVHPPVPPRLWAVTLKGEKVAFARAREDIEPLAIPPGVHHQPCVQRAMLHLCPRLGKIRRSQQVHISRVLEDGTLQQPSYRPLGQPKLQGGGQTCGESQSSVQARTRVICPWQQGSLIRDEARSSRHRHGPVESTMD
jgi:hypothetical protein